MRRWIEWAARCYPAGWRERYGEEFAALLEDAEPHWRDVWDVLRGALSVQLKTPAAYLKFGVAMAVIGAIAAGAASLAMPRRYVSTAVLRSAHPLDTGAALGLRLKQQQLVSRNSLSEMIQRPGLELYPEERRRYPLEDLLQAMRDRDLRIQGDPAGVRITFEYADPVKAQAVVRDLSTRLGGGALEVEAREPARGTGAARLGAHDCNRAAGRTRGRTSTGIPARAHSAVGTKDCSLFARRRHGGGSDLPAPA